MNDAKTIINRILSGDLAGRAQGYMIVLPRGYSLEGLIEECLLETYGTEHHPDVRRLSPEGAGDMIKVDAVRDAQGFLASTASGDGMKTLVLYRAHRMNDNAANALLKPLEEPTRQTRILLVTDNPAPLPSTIRSRCGVFTIAPDEELAIRELTAILQQEGAKPSKDSPQALLTLADGDPALAAEIARHGLSAWLKKAQDWLGGSDATPPLPAPLSGKSAVPLKIAALALQAVLARAAREEIAIKGWTLDRVIRAGWQSVERNTDVTRAGIDARTRLHSLMKDLRSA